MQTRPRVAIAHDYLTQRGGAERVVLALAEKYPDAPIHTTLYDPGGTYPEFRQLDVRPSRLNVVPAFRRNHRLAFPLLGWASERTLVDADVVIASTSGWAHGFGGEHRTLVYCHSPARWLYCGDQYVPAKEHPGKAWVLRAMSRRLLEWDREQALRADRYLVNSRVVRQRVAMAYGIKADVVPAPITEAFGAVEQEPVDDPFVRQGDHYLCVSRLLPYKNVHHVVEAFRSLPELHLVVVGSGPERERLLAGAPPNVHFLQHLTDGQLATVYARSRALVSASHEDYGLTPLEAASMGRPSVVLRAGGFLDTMVEGVTAVFFDTPAPDAVREAVLRCEATEWDEWALVDHAASFSQDAFLNRIDAEVDALLGTRERV